MENVLDTYALDYNEEEPVVCIDEKSYQLLSDVFSALERQCIRKRIPNIEDLKKQVSIWVDERNKKKVQINWCFTTDDARTKFQRFYKNITNL